ncbi:MAG TPA: hypothetical protein VIL10_09370 [Marmoricola sp.]|jgi:hypothetical protein
MAGHKPVVVTDNADRFFGKCNCGWNSGLTRRLQRWQAEDDVREHERNVELAVANLRRGRGSLRTDRDHAAQMLEDPNVSAKDKRVWQIIFDGADQRLNDHTADDGDGLW